MCDRLCNLGIHIVALSVPAGQRLGTGAGLGGWKAEICLCRCQHMVRKDIWAAQEGTVSGTSSEGCEGLGCIMRCKEYGSTGKWGVEDRIQDYTELCVHW